MGTRSVRKCQRCTKCPIFLDADKETLWRARIIFTSEVGDDIFLSISHLPAYLDTLSYEEDTRYTRVEYDPQVRESIFREKSLRRLGRPADRCDRDIRESSYRERSKKSERFTREVDHIRMSRTVRTIIGLHDDPRASLRDVEILPQAHIAYRC